MTKIETSEMWEKLVKEYKTSDMNIPDWCNLNNIKPNTFRYWLYKKKSDSVILSKSETINWIPIIIEDDKYQSTTDKILVVKIGAAAIEVSEGFNKKLLQEIISVLVASC